MSIVTDALNRLQSMRADVERLPVAPDPQPSPSNETDSHDAPDESKGHTNFLTVAIGSFLVIAIMALGAFWWGESLVVGVPQLTYSMASYADDSSVPVTENPKPNDVFSSDQSVSNAMEFNTDESTDDVRGLISEEIDQEGIIHPSREGEEQTFTPDESASLIKNEAQEINESLSNQSDHRSEQTNSDGVISLSLAIAEKDEPSQVASLTIADPEELQRSDAALNLASLKDSDKQFSDLVPAMSAPQPQHSSPDLEGKTARISNRAHVSQEPSFGRRAEVVASKASTRLSPQQRLTRAQALIAQQSHAEALQVLNPLFATLPVTWEPWFWMGTAQLGVGNLDKAENAFMEGLVRDDTIPHLWVQRAVIEQQRGQYILAMDALRQAELLAPDLPEVQLNLAYNLEQQGNPKLARGHYQQYLSLTEGKPTYHAVRRKVLERVVRMGRS